MAIDKCQASIETAVSFTVLDFDVLVTFKIHDHSCIGCSSLNQQFAVICHYTCEPAACSDVLIVVYSGHSILKIVLDVHVVQFTSRVVAESNEYFVGSDSLHHKRFSARYFALQSSHLVEFGVLLEELTGLVLITDKCVSTLHKQISIFDGDHFSQISLIFKISMGCPLSLAALVFGTCGTFAAWV